MKINEKELKVEKLTLQTLVDLLGSLKEIPQVLNQWTAEDDKNMVAGVQKIILASFPEFCLIVEKLTNLTADEVKGLGVKDGIDVMLQILDANDIAEIKESVKKLTARFKAK